MLSMFDGATSPSCYFAMAIAARFLKIVNFCETVTENKKGQRDAYRG